MMDPSLSAGVSWSYTADLRREGAATLRENSAEATVTAVEAANSPQKDTDIVHEPVADPRADREVRFERDAEIGALLFQVINTRTDEVVFQLPTEIMLNLRKFYAENAPANVPSFKASL